MSLELGTGTTLPDFSILTTVNAVFPPAGSARRNRFSANTEWVISLLVPAAEISFAERFFACDSIVNESEVEALASALETDDAASLTVIESVSEADISEILPVGR